MIGARRTTKRRKLAQGLHNFDASGYQGGSNHLSSEIGGYEGEISDMEAEMNAIEKAMDSNWK